jgi:hypothetical protein
MRLIVDFQNVLKKPFPEQFSSFGAPATVVIISLFVTLFLYIFQPFGISDLESEKFIICLGFGLITFVASIIFEFVVGYLLKLKGKPENWTFGKWIIYNLGAMVTISLANFLFVRVALFGSIEWQFLPAMIYGTFMIGIIPIMVIGGFALLTQEKKYQLIAQDINQNRKAQTENIATKAQTLFNIPVDQIKYMEALQNYVTIGYIDTKGQLKIMTERTTLKNILEQLGGSSIIQSHRSYLVNKDAILSTSGNAQGLLLELSGCDRKIPVSRSYVSLFRD